MTKPTDRNYTNDRREGVTHPDKVEILEPTDPRHPAWVAPRPMNRSDRRSRGFRSSSKRVARDIAAKGDY